MKTKAPIITITDLHYSDKEIADVKRIETEIQITKRKEKLRALLGGPMCATCWDVPSKRVEYQLDGVRRIECWCDKHFLEVFEKTKDVTNETLAETYGCVKGEQK